MHSALQYKLFSSSSRFLNATAEWRLQRPATGASSRWLIELESKAMSSVKRAQATDGPQITALAAYTSPFDRSGLHHVDDDHSEEHVLEINAENPDRWAAKCIEQVDTTQHAYATRTVTIAMITARSPSCLHKSSAALTLVRWFSNSFDAVHPSLAMDGRRCRQRQQTVRPSLK
jgi:hypothetical protein